MQPIHPEEKDVLVPDDAKDFSAFIFRVKHSVFFFYCIDWPWRCKQYDSLKHQELHNQQYNLQPPSSMGFILLEQLWTRRLQAFPQHQWLYPNIHGITSQRTWIFSNIAVGTSNFTSWWTIQTVWRMQSNPMKLHYFQRYHNFVKCYRDLKKKKSTSKISFQMSVQ